MHYVGSGDNEREEEQSKGNREMERREGNGVKHKEGSFEQAPGLSRGRGRAVSTTLPSVKQTDGEREGGVKVGGGWERWRGSSDSARRSNEHSLSLSLSQRVSEVELRGRWEHIDSVHHKA